MQGMGKSRPNIFSCLFRFKYFQVTSVPKIERTLTSVALAVRFLLLCESSGSLGVMGGEIQGAAESSTSYNGKSRRITVRLLLHRVRRARKQSIRKTYLGEHDNSKYRMANWAVSHRLLGQISIFSNHTRKMPSLQPPPPNFVVGAC